MLKEVGIILSLVGCILLIAPMSGWLFYWGYPIGNLNSLPLYFALPLAVLGYALYYAKTLWDHEHYVKVQYFACSLLLTFGFSFALLLAILPFFKPNFVL